MGYDNTAIKTNDDLIRDIPEELWDEIISYDHYIEEPIPWDIVEALRVYVPSFSKTFPKESYYASLKFYNEHDLTEEEQYDKENGYQLTLDFYTFFTEVTLDWIEKYPQFKPLVKGYTCFKDGKIVGFVELD